MNKQNASQYRNAALPAGIDEASACQVNAVDVSFRASGKSILEGISFEVEAGSGLSIVGPSGSGKTTLLRCLAGLEHPTSGSVQYSINGVRAVRRNELSMGFVFQDLGIFERSTVRQNIFLGEERRFRSPYTHHVIETLGLAKLLDQDTQWLSGGERQRVAIARALVRTPQVLFLDEPLSSIDPMLSVELELMIAALQYERPFSLLYVTHLVESAIRMNPRIAFLSAGHLLQIGELSDLYEKPASGEILNFFEQFPAVKIDDAWMTSGERLSGEAFCRAGELVIAKSAPSLRDDFHQEVKAIRAIDALPSQHLLVRSITSGSTYVAAAPGFKWRHGERYVAIARRDRLIKFDRDKTQ